MKLVITTLSISLIVLTACSLKTASENIHEPEPSHESELSSEEYEYTASLKDVSGGESYGEASAKFDAEINTYMLHATFTNLPATENGDFYEGWIVRKSPTSVLSTGKTELIDGTHTNTFTADGDLRDHDFYVLTLEPNDGDPAPDKHILEGTLTK